MEEAVRGAIQSAANGFADMGIKAKLAGQRMRSALQAEGQVDVNIDPTVRAALETCAEGFDKIDVACNEAMQAVQDAMDGAPPPPPPN